MAITLFGAYCLVLRKSEKTAFWEADARKHLMEVSRRFMERTQGHPGMPPFEDDALFAYPAGASPMDPEASARQLEVLRVSEHGGIRHGSQR